MGLVILVGVVVNNGIVLLDLVTRLRREGADRTAALVQAGRTRMRPIPMTALTTIFGVLPHGDGHFNLRGDAVCSSGTGGRWRSRCGYPSDPVLRPVLVLGPRRHAGNRQSLGGLGGRPARVFPRTERFPELQMILLTPVFCVGLTAGAADLGYEQALEQALSRNPTIQIAGAGVERADGALLAARAVFDTTLTANSSSSSTVTQSPQLQGVNIDDRNSNFGTTISHFFPTGTTTSLAWQNRQSTTLYLAENQTALDQLRGFGLINEDIRYQSSLVATMRQSLLDGFRMSANLQGVRTAQRARDQADAARLRTRQEVLAQTARAYWEALVPGSSGRHRRAGARSGPRRTTHRELEGRAGHPRPGRAGRGRCHGRAGGEQPARRPDRLSVGVQYSARTRGGIPWQRAQPHHRPGRST